MSVSTIKNGVSDTVTNHGLDFGLHVEQLRSVVYVIQFQDGLIGFGASAPGEIVMRELGFTPEHIVKFAKSILAGNRPE
jgi:transketolase